MSAKKHEYDVTVVWSGNRGTGTSNYSAYSRDHDLSTAQASTISGSADPAFRGDPTRWNPEQLQVAALSQCHMLWYLHLAATAGVVVTAYEDHAHGVMTQDETGGGQFESVTLHPLVTITAGSDPDKALAAHSKVPEVCFIARSVNFPVHHKPNITVADADRLTRRP